MRQMIVLLATLACVICFCPKTKSSEKLSISGYFKNYSLALNRPEIANLPETKSQSIIGAVNNRLRLKVASRMNHWMSLTLAYDFSPRIQDRSLFEEQALNLGLNQQIYRAADLGSRLYPDECDSVSSFAIFQNLDRAFLTVKTSLADIYVGRQAINWGSARVINPTDVLAPYTFNELDVEDRIGVDAVRFRMPMGFMSELDAGYVFGDDFQFKNSAVFLRSKLYYRRTDFSLLSVAFRENLLAGFDLSRSIGGAGFWLEAGYVFVHALSSDVRDHHQDYFRSSVGMDYSLRNGTYLFAEYHFNQAGAKKPEDYLTSSVKTAYREGSVYLLGKHYFAPGIAYQLTPLVTLNGQALVNMTDPSIFVMAQLEYNFAENVYLSAGAYPGLGKSPHFMVDPSAGPTLRLRSEFGSYPDFYFTSFRIYF
jgi:hypothetical protein